MRSPWIKFFAFTQVTLASTICFAAVDPVATDFIRVADMVASQIEINPHIASGTDPLGPGIDSSIVRSFVNQLKSNAAQNREESLISVQSERPVDQSGVAKAAVFTRSPLRVAIHRATWANASNREKVTLVAMELLGLAGVTENRYSMALSGFGSIADNILNGRFQRYSDCMTVTAYLVTAQDTYRQGVNNCVLYGHRPGNSPGDGPLPELERLATQLHADCRRECGYENNPIGIRGCQNIMNALQTVKQTYLVHRSACVQ